MSSLSDSQSSDFDSTKYIDIGANLLDSKFQGIYNGSQKHPPDLDVVLSRSLANYPRPDGTLDPQAPCQRIIITAGSLSESLSSLSLCSSINSKTNFPSTSTTCGFHPTRSNEFTPAMEQFILDHHRSISAFGELGLDYDRLEFADKDIQLSSLNSQLSIISSLSSSHSIKKPLFLHSRSCSSDLYDILLSYKISNGLDTLNGVVHSYDDSIELALKYISLGLYIGLNGCSFRTDSNVEVVRGLPLERLMLETDAPWCDIRKSHEGWEFVGEVWEEVKEKKWKEGCRVKNRNEPGAITRVAEVLAGIKGISVEEVRKVCGENSMNLFFR
ncbi:hypothetical protein TrVE_jg2853 [Triparma verrucosa]|uniref:Uncharacterized protein n=2 Tax=Triparma TaxID=722752 RepID=A0A9W7C1Y7_9STRA|nr:hypothetical protein TrVE_jg2853 [Triparma verrucosa]GMH97734.1 hypothetical protein TrST_g164 [Triparma strigata]